TYNTIIASGLVGIFKKIYAESWGPRLEHILRNTILSLLEYPNTTMLGITRILQDDKFRAQVVKKMEDPIVKSFWVNEFDKMQPKFRTEAISPILNKVGQFLSSPIIRNIVGQPKSAVDFRFLMDNNRIVIVNLSKGKIGEDNSALLGAMVITKFQLEAMSRSDTPEKDRKDFYLYVDEFQNFATESFATILSEARKYKLNLTMANQYIAQMPDEVRDAVFGNVGTILSFQVGYDDAEYISQQFGEEVLPPDLVSLSKFTAYTRLLIDNMPSKTFSLSTLPPVEVKEDEGRREKIIKVSREKFTKKREMVEDKIKRWSEGSKKIEVAKNWDKKKR
ncbi:TraM recognition domain-containing protein, partial [Patescibacteria group bacterium]|nr:TraM recognition domain-containing protein [Patescibacteria group bacterium]